MKRSIILAFGLYLSLNLLGQSSTILRDNACINCDSAPSATLDVRGGILSLKNQVVKSAPGTFGHSLANENGTLRWIIRGRHNETGINKLA